MATEQTSANSLAMVKDIHWPVRFAANGIAAIAVDRNFHWRF